MCDSHISESCPMDFTNYCPVDSVCSEGRYKRPTRKSQAKNHITWFGRKTKGISSNSSKEFITSKQGRNGQLWSECSVHALKEDCGNSSCSPRHECPCRNKHVLDSSSDEDCFGNNGQSLEKASPYVSQEELDALKGCVMRRRAVFSPSPSSSPVHSYVQVKSHSPALTNSLPAGGKRRFRVPEEGSHIRQSSLEYDHLKDFDPLLPVNDVVDSVSVQFRLQGDSEGPSEDSVMHSSSISTGFKKHSVSNNESSLSYSIPERLDWYVCRDRGAMASANGNDCSCDLHSGVCSTWPQKELLTKEATEVSKGGKTIGSPLSVKSTRTQQQQYHSPLHSKFNSPLLQVKHQVYPFEGILKTCDTGSSYSLYSQSTTVSSLTDRQHCSYSKGVDGNLFKTRCDDVLAWFSEFSDQQRNMMLMKLLEQCDCAQMHFLSVQMEPVLHEGCPHNCQDLLSWLPFNVVTHIFGFLDPVSLCQAGAVNKDWYHAASQENLWKRFCRLEKWRLSVSGESKYQSKFVNPHGGSIKWKYLFAEKYRLRRNWLKGYCSVRTFEGHTQGISCIQFDDTRIVSGSWDKTIKVWNRRTNTVWAALTLAGHSGTVRCLHLHNNRLVSGSSDRTIKVWDLATDKVGWVGAACRATMVGHMHTVRCLQADDEKVISGSYDQTLKIWDIKTGQCQLTLRGHTDAVLCLQFDGHKVVSGSKDKTIKIWSLPDGVCKLTFHGHEAAVSCLHFDESRIISGALDRLIKIWNLVTGECIRTIDWIRSEGHTGVIRHLQADSWKIISAADDKTLKVWNVHTGNRLLTLKSHTDGVTCLQFNDEVIVSGSYDKTVKLWDFSSC